MWQACSPKVHELFQVMKDKIEPLIIRFNTYCELKRNITVIRYNFNTRNQRPGEGFESYYTELRNTVEDCEFGSLEDNLRDRLVCGIGDKIVREKLLKVDLTREKWVNMCRLFESSAKQLRTLGSSQMALEKCVNMCRLFESSANAVKNSWIKSATT